MKKFKSQKGAISLFALLSVFFFIAFMMGAYRIVSAQNSTQIDSIETIQERYTVTTAQAKILYDNKNGTNDVIPISTAKEFALIGTNNAFEKNGKIYTCSVGSKYYLTNDIIIDIDTDMCGETFNFNEYLIRGGTTGNSNFSIDKAGYDLYYFKDNAYYKMLIYQDFDTEDKKYFVSSNFTITSEGVTSISSDYKDKTRYSDLVDMLDTSKANQKYKKFGSGNNEFQFMYMIDKDGTKRFTANYNIVWLQERNPFKQIASTEATYRTMALNQGITSEATFFGMAVSSTSGMSSLIDGDSNPSNWYYGIGSFGDFNGGIKSIKLGGNDVVAYKLAFLVRVK